MALGGAVVAGTLVELVNEATGVLTVGVLVSDTAEGVYGMHEIVLDTGRSFRTAGRVYRKRQ